MNRLRELTKRLIAQDTESRHGNLPAMAELAERLESAGFATRLQRWGEGAGEKANLIAWAGPPEPDGLILSGHLDIVPFQDQPGWTRDPLQLGEDEARLYGRGTSDMKVFLAQCVDAASELDIAALRRPVVFLFTSDEEIGCLGAARLAPELETLLGEIPKPKLAWIGEPTSWNVFHTHKGIVAFTVRVRGEGGHSSVPEAGVNAIAVAAQALASVGALQAELRGRGRPQFAEIFPEAPYTTLNFGTIQGGTASNMIAERCDFSVSYRPLPDEEPLAVYHQARDRLLERVPSDWGSEKGARLEVSEPLFAPGLLTPPGTALEEALRAELGAGPLAGAPFCTDGGRFEVAGIHSLICGPGDLDQAHQPNESISLAAFAEGTEHILRVTRRLCIGP